MFAFDCLDHELLIAKLNTYYFSLPALRTENREHKLRIFTVFG